MLTKLNENTALVFVVKAVNRFFSKDSEIADFCKAMFLLMLLGAIIDVLST